MDEAMSDSGGVFPVEDIVQYPLPGYSAPSSIAFRPDDALISYLYSPDHTLSRQLYVFDPETWQQRLLVSPPKGGVEEANLSTAEKLRRERLRERGLGVTRYEWSKNSSSPCIMIPLPDGVYIQDPSSPELRLCIPSSASKPVLDPQISPNGNAIAYISDDELFVMSTASPESHRITPPSEAAPAEAGSFMEDSSLAPSAYDLNAPSTLCPPDTKDDSRLSSAGTALRENGVIFQEGSTGQDGPQRLQLTFGAKESGKVHGLAEYIAQEELERRNGFWWSNDSSMIAFTEVDGKAVPLFKIVHQGTAAKGKEAEEDHAYPFAGEANVSVRLGVVPAKGGDVRWMDLIVGVGGSAETEDEEYLARVMWLPDGSLSAQVLNRAQTRLKLLRFDVGTGRREVLLVEENPVWVNLHDSFTPLQKGVGYMKGGFIWASERTGFCHLYMYDGRGRCIGALTEGEWTVESVAGVDERSQTIYFTGTLDSPLESHLYSVHWVLEEQSGLSLSLASATQSLSSHTSLSPSSWVATIGLRRLTQGKGRHSVVLDHQLQRFVDIHDSLDTPPHVSLCSIESEGTPVATIFEQPSPPTPQLRRLKLLPPELMTLQSPDGVVLQGMLYKPDEKKFGAPPYRTVVSVYGGPKVQTVLNSWTATVDMRAQYLRSRGILVWKLDNRGSSRRGLAFEGAIKHNMGGVDADDQACGVSFLIGKGLTDPLRVGIYGWSYGGYLAAMCLARHPSLFNCAVAGAPVTSWDGYDTCYTERYMGRPSENAAAFERASVMSHVASMRGRLLLVHGMIDENVHFRHTVRLINAMTSASKEYELLIFPEERHMPRGLKDRIHMECRIFAFLDSNL